MWKSIKSWFTITKRTFGFGTTPKYVKVCLVQQSYSGIWDSSKEFIVENTMSAFQANPEIRRFVYTHIMRGGGVPLPILENFKFTIGTVYDCSDVGGIAYITVFELTDSEMLLYTND